jgi:hypothetical protein
MMCCVPLSFLKYYQYHIQESIKDYNPKVKIITITNQKPKGQRRLLLTI